ncbi:hypothetical protein EMN47_19645 [Prolixibacteraceae bacterium JC049]|nr:hypothetical protein [Prolixibacteraceae bacterium JC049]
MSSLKIYKASAGSGKTYRLALEFLKIVLSNPKDYRKVLAVTFTNKATAEMKSRILNELHELTITDNSGYLDALVEETGLSKQDIKLKAQEVLNYFLHDYSRFAVSTIDSFFQNVIRSFGREIGIHSGFNIEMNDKAVLEESIDRLFFNLDKNESLSKWLLDYAENQLRNGKSWNFRNEVSRFAENIFKEDFKQLPAEILQKISDKSFMDGYRKELNKVKLEFEKYYEKLGKEAEELIQNAGLRVESFVYGKTGVAGYLVRLKNGPVEPGKRAMDARNEPSKWYSGKTASDVKVAIEGAFNNGLNRLLNDAVDTWYEKSAYYFTAKEIVNNLYQLGMLNDLAQELRNYCRDNNIMLLSDSGELLSHIINDGETPFVYEKIGNHFQNYMIDEFQDTSGMQWNNLRPLVGNALAEGEDCLIVGDVKQSIYRWRNGDWKLLAHQVKEDLGDWGVREVNMDRNWRSSNNVVSLVNTIFKYAPSVLVQDIQNEVNDKVPVDGLKEKAEIINEAYKAHHQHVQKSGLKGLVNIELLNAERGVDWQAESLDKMVENIEALQDRNVPLKDISILVRTGREGQKVVDRLLEAKKSANGKYRYDVISSYSLYIENAPSVRFILGFLKFLNDSSDEVNQAYLISDFQKYLLPQLKEMGKQPPIAGDNNAQLNLFDSPVDNEPDWQQLFEESEQVSKRFFPFFFDEDQQQLVDKLRFSSLTETVNEIIRMYGFNELTAEIPFLFAFLDELENYSMRENSDITSFLEWWDMNGSAKTIDSAEGQDAIQVFTIHKSKGLEFKAVIIPFCSWDLVPKNGTMMWCFPPCAPYDQLAITPVAYGKSLVNSLFAPNYIHEKILSYVDNLNLLYVALTRAEEALYVYAPKSKKLNGVDNVAKLLQHILDNCSTFSNEEDFSMLQLSDYLIENGLRAGGIELFQAKARELTVQNYQLNRLNITDYSRRLKLRMHSQDYFIVDENPRQTRINHGKIVHETLAAIHTKDDLKRIIDKKVLEGKISVDEADELQMQLNGALEQELVASWFDGSWEVYNERDILLSNGSSRRPDRIMVKENQCVVVDFKTGEEDDKYLKQVAAYMKLLTEIGFTSVEGYIWYIHKNEVVEVK